MHVIFAKPRGFCAGVVRAIAIVEKSLALFGSPLYVKHAIVHNRHEVKRLEKLGVIFVENIADIPEGSRVIFSAHGSPPESFMEARMKNLDVIDAVCPLVIKVHNEVRNYGDEGRTIILVGHRNHVEVIGTSGEAPNHVLVVESVEDAEHVVVPHPEMIAYTTQTTLSIDDASMIVEVLKQRFPKILGPRKADICYATQNRQDAVKKLTQLADLILIFGSKESSNANRLVEVAKKEGVPAYLLEDASMLTQKMFTDDMVVGISSGASTPEALLDEVAQQLKAFGAKSIEIMEADEEHIHFALPKMLGKKENSDN